MANTAMCARLTQWTPMGSGYCEAHAKQSAAKPSAVEFEPSYAGMMLSSKPQYNHAKQKICNNTPNVVCYTHTIGDPV